MNNSVILDVMLGTFVFSLLGTMVLYAFGPKGSSTISAMSTATMFLALMMFGLVFP